MMTEAGYPLSGVRVLDLSRVLAGPICTQILADLGADVVKVERPGQGDDTREWGPPFLPPAENQQQGESGYFLSCNRGKRSLALDLAEKEGTSVLTELIGHADVLVENFLPDALVKFGLTPDRLTRLNPKLVSCSISAFGRTGPNVQAPGYDLMIQAAAGMMSITGEPEGTPMKVGVAITDVLTGLYATVSVLAGLVAQRQGETTGRTFDVALADCTLASLVNVAQSTLLTGERPRRYGNAHPQIVPYETFTTRDGFLAVAIGTDRQWQRFCAAVDRKKWATAPHFGTNPARVEHRSELIPLLQSLFAGRSTSEWQKLLVDQDIPHSPVMSIDDVLKSSQVTARQMVTEVIDSSGRQYQLLGSPIHWQSEPLRKPLAPPRLGEHTDQVLAEWLGYSADKIALLKSAGAVT